MNKIAAVDIPTEYKLFLAGDFKATNDEQGIIEGILNAIGNVDDGLDRTQPGAFTKTIELAYRQKKAQNYDYLWPYMWNHDYDLIPPGGIFDADEVKAQGDRPAGLFTKVRLTLDYQLGRDLYTAFKAGTVRKQSMGYKTLEQDWVKEQVDGQNTMVRNLIEVQLLEGSAVVFPMNQLADVTNVKSGGLWTPPKVYFFMHATPPSETKTVCGNTSGPIGPRDESWDGGKAKGQIWAAAYDADSGKINTSLAKKYFMSCDGDAQQKGSYGLPFWYVGDSPHICVGAVKAIAGAVQGSRGASLDGADAIKSKVAALYGRINSKYPDDPELTPPWKDDGKASTRAREKKTFQEHYQDEQCDDLLEDWQDVLLCALTSAVLDAFQIGDTPEADVEDALTAFHEAAMAWVAQAQAYNLSDYLEENSYRSSPAEYTMQYGSESRPDYGYMSNRVMRERKIMLSSDATMGGFTADHVDKLKSAASKAMQKVQDHADALHTAADTVKSLVSKATVSSEKSFGQKAGRVLSAANVATLSDHADSLDDAADSLTKSIKRSTNQVQSVADDLATILQGSEAAYGTDPGDAGDQQEGKHRGASYLRTRPTHHARSSRADTVDEAEIAAALVKLRALTTTA